MEANAFDIEKLLHEKIALYQSLVAVLEQEKKSLIASDVESLWHFATQKQECARDIEELRKRIMAELDRMGIDHGMNPVTFRVERIFALLPGSNDRLAKGLRQALLAVKTKVHALSRANKNFVEEYLSVLDEMIGIITSVGKTSAPYEKMRGPDSRERANLLLHREV